MAAIMTGLVALFVSGISAMWLILKALVFTPLEQIRKEFHDFSLKYAHDFTSVEERLKQAERRLEVVGNRTKRVSHSD